MYVMSLLRLVPYIGATDVLENCYSSPPCLASGKNRPADSVRAKYRAKALLGRQELARYDGGNFPHCQVDFGYPYIQEVDCLFPGVMATA